MEQSCSCTLSLTSALNVSECLTPRPGRFCTGKETHDAFYRRLGEPQDRSGRQENSRLPSGFDPRTVQSVANRRTEHQIPAPISIQATDKAFACFCSYNMYAFSRYITIVSLKKKGTIIHFIQICLSNSECLLSASIHQTLYHSLIHQPTN
jgi:hypothetical protein